MHSLPHEMTMTPIEDPQLEISAAALVEPRAEAADESSLLREVTASIAGASCVRDAIELVLREVCALTGWELGQAWTRNGGSYLECSPAWCAASEELLPFRERSASMTFEPGVGLPGRAW